MARLFIGGQFRTKPVIEATTGERLGDGSVGTESEVEAFTSIYRVGPSN